MVSEFIIGRHGASNTARAYTKVAGKGWRLALGWLFGRGNGVSHHGILRCCGWLVSCRNICTLRLQTSTEDHAAIASYFSGFSASAFMPVFWTTIILLFTHCVVATACVGVSTSKMFMPTFDLYWLSLASCMLPGASKASLFSSIWLSKVNSNVFLDALGQSFYSLSIAMGCICTYASYFSRQTNLLKSAVRFPLSIVWLLF